MRSKTTLRADTYSRNNYPLAEDWYPTRQDSLIQCFFEATFFLAISDDFSSVVNLLLQLFLVLELIEFVSICFRTIIFTDSQPLTST